MSREWRALRLGESATIRRREIERAYERFLTDDLQDAPHEAGLVREVVLESWRRSLDREVDPDAALREAALSADELAELRRVHPLAAALPVLERLLFTEAETSGFIVAIGDAAGRLLWVEGDRRMRGLAERIGFVSGADWSERAVGTSAPGSALAFDHSIQVFGAEHFNRGVHQWSCAATPIHDPETGEILGVIDITGGETVAEPHVLPLVEATRVAVEAELKVEALRRKVEDERRARTPPGSNAGPSAGPRAGSSVGSPLPAPARLAVLGRAQAVLETPDGPLEISRRHAEILLALSEDPRGLGASALAEAVYGDQQSAPTLRAELVRLRALLAAHRVPLGIGSKPYRLTAPLRVDAREALAALGRGAHRLALATYGGPVLPGSDAPAANELRAEVDATLREAMLQCAAHDLLFEYAQQWAVHDPEVWETLIGILPPLSPKRSRAVARLEALRSAER